MNDDNDPLPPGLPLIGDMAEDKEGGHLRKKAKLIGCDDLPSNNVVTRTVLIQEYRTLRYQPYDRVVLPQFSYEYTKQPTPETLDNPDAFLHFVMGEDACEKSNYDIIHCASLLANARLADRAQRKNENRHNVDTFTCRMYMCMNNLRLKEYQERMYVDTHDGDRIKVHDREVSEVNQVVKDRCLKIQLWETDVNHVQHDMMQLLFCYNEETNDFEYYDAVEVEVTNPRERKTLNSTVDMSALEKNLGLMLARHFFDKPWLLNSVETLMEHE